MLPSGKIIKQTAIISMKNNRLNTSVASMLLVCVLVIGSLISDIISEVTSNIFAVCFCVLYFIFIGLPVFFGEFLYFRRAVWGEKENPAEVFNVFGNKRIYRRALRTGFAFVLRIAVTLFISLIPAIITGLLSEPGFYDFFKIGIPSFAPSLSVVSSVLTVIGVALTVIVNLKFYLVPFLMASNDDITVYEAAKLSRTLSRSSVPDFCWLVLSMAGWIILSVLLVPLVFTLPYFFASYTVHCRFCVAQYNGKASESAAGTPSYNPKF